MKIRNLNNTVSYPKPYLNKVCTFVEITETTLMAPMNAGARSANDFNGIAWLVQCL